MFTIFLTKDILINSEKKYSECLISVFTQIFKDSLKTYIKIKLEF